MRDPGSRARTVAPPPEAPAAGVGTDSAPVHLPLVEEARDPAHAEARPTWRGWIHAVTTPVALLGGLALIALGRTQEARWAAVVFVLTSLLLFGNSALYHRIDWSPPVKRTLKRVDHANIFLLIAGTYTPLALLALPPAQGVVLLWAVWIVAALGVAFRVLWVGAPRWLYTPIYVALGWAALFYIVPLFERAPAAMTLVVIGGALYSAGALVYGIKRPNPAPGRFGFHEVFHTCTVLAYLCHWAATLLLVLRPVA